MKILWFSNCVLSEQDTGATGTWLHAMAQGLNESGDVELANISDGMVKAPERTDFGKAAQWTIPPAKLSADGLPSRHIIREIVKIVDDFAPDLIHIWGTEAYWGLLKTRGFLHSPVVLGIQGLKGMIARVYDGGLNFREKLQCIGIKELIRRSTIFQGKRRFARWGKFEREMIAGHRHIIVQSRWDDAQIKTINPKCHTIPYDYILRQPFYQAESWQYIDKPIIFCSAAYSSPFKGLHIAVKALKHLRNKYPDVELHIVGAHRLSGLRRDGYIAWVNRQIAKFGLTENVKWLGALSALQIVEELKNCAVVVQPSFVEGYSLVLAETMMLGIPAVVSYAAGLPTLAQDEATALFFPPGDDTMCAYQIERLFKDRTLAEKISCNARKTALTRNDRQKLIDRQIEIYREVLTNI